MGRVCLWSAAALAVAALSVMAGTWIIQRNQERISREENDPQAKARSAAEEVWSYNQIPAFPGRRRDEIRAINRPAFSPRSTTDNSPRDDDLVIGVARGGIARAYPLWIMKRREIVNDRFGDEPVCVTYCPLSASAVVFLSRIGDEEFVFGNEGTLYECNLVMYDRQSSSLWYQIPGRCIRGPRLNQELTQLPASVTEWRHWRQRFPSSAVLVADGELGSFFRVFEDPSLEHGAGSHGIPAAPVSHIDPRLPADRIVFGFRHGGQTGCLDAEGMDQWGDGRHPIPGLPVTLVLNRENDELTVVGSDASQLPIVRAYWFAWQAAFPAGMILPASPE